MPAKVVEQALASCAEREVRVRQSAERIERRHRVRTHVHWQVELPAMGLAGIIHSTTRDLSSRGFCCDSPVPFTPGEHIFCKLKVPAYHPERSDWTLSLECQVRIARVAPADHDGTYILGCEIEDYRFQ